MENNLTQRALPAPLFHIDIDGVRHVAAARLAAQSGYCRDYITRLARECRIAGRRLGTDWYIDERSFWNFFIEQEARNAQRRIDLASARRREFESAQSTPENSL